MLAIRLGDFFLVRRRPRAEKILTGNFDFSFLSSFYPVEVFKVLLKWHSCITLGTLLEASALSAFFDYVLQCQSTDPGK